MSQDKYEIPVPRSPVDAEEPVQPDEPAQREQSGWERMMEILNMPQSWRRGLYKEWFGLWSSIFIGVGLIAAIFAAVLLYLFFAGDDNTERANADRPPGSGAGDSSGGGRNDDNSDDDALQEYEPPGS